MFERDRQTRRWDVHSFVNKVYDQQHDDSLVKITDNFANTFAMPALSSHRFQRYVGIRLALGI